MGSHRDYGIFIFLLQSHLFIQCTAASSFDCGLEFSLRTYVHYYSFIQKLLCSEIEINGEYSITVSCALHKHITSYILSAVQVANPLC